MYLHGLTQSEWMPMQPTSTTGLEPESPVSSAMAAAAAVGTWPALGWEQIFAVKLPTSRARVCHQDQRPGSSHIDESASRC
ncbi:hypothetical protein ACCO45_003366 [Purpureocillium lilacinum]|uniref:Uncharacterized protein n=1 Tax=Purpureocillium lilacinum TaxID=33203 RepID=A0ACC4E0M0_PURLI